MKEAIRLWVKAWDMSENAAAANALGFIYSFDEKMKDEEKAFSWFEKSAKAGLPLAAGNVGNCYFYGRGSRRIWKRQSTGMKLALRPDSSPLCSSSALF